MADPFTAIIATAASVAGSIASGNAEYQSAMGESAIAGENASRSRMSARQARAVGNAAEEAKRREVRRSLGRTAAAMGQSGTGGPSYGSNAGVLKQAGAEGELDALDIRYEANMEGYNHELEASNYEAQKRAARRRARGAKWSTAVNIASDIAGGYANYSGRQARRPPDYPSHKTYSPMIGASTTRRKKGY